MSTEKPSRHFIWCIYESLAAKDTYICRKCTKVIVLKVVKPEAAFSTGKFCQITVFCSELITWLNMSIYL